MRVRGARALTSDRAISRGPRHDVGTVWRWGGGGRGGGVALKSVSECCVALRLS